MTPVVNGQDIVQLASRHAFIGHVKRQPPVRDTFFPTSSRQPLADSWSPEVAAVLQDDVTWFDFSRYSVLYVAQAICKLRDKFLVHTMLEEDIVSEQLKAMHDSSGWKKIGQITFCFLREFSVWLAEPLTAIFNASLCEGHVPLEWKLANVVPLPKQNPPRDITSDIRPSL